MAIKYLYQYFPIQGPPKFTQIGIFGLKRNHLATAIEIGVVKTIGSSNFLLEESTDL
jgi:hypothetical protein